MCVASKMGSNYAKQSVALCMHVLAFSTKLILLIEINNEVFLQVTYDLNSVQLLIKDSAPPSGMQLTSSINAPRK